MKNTQHAGRIVSFIITAIALVFSFSFFASTAYATEGDHKYKIEDTGTQIFGDFVLENAKIEVALDPGETASQDMVVINRTERDVKFLVSVEDFTGSPTGESSARLLGDERGPYSLKDYFNPEVWEFVLKSGQKITLPVEISVPEDATPGGLYGSVLVASQPAGGGQNPVISRLGALFFVRVNGEVVEDGLLESFVMTPSQKIFTKGTPEKFTLTTRNNGTVHMNSYGIIQITNSLGVIVDEVEVEPYFTLPNAVRSADIIWESASSLLVGRYTATALINRGYDDIIDEMSVSFWIMPTGLIVKWFIGIVIFIILLRLIFSKFEIRTRK